jgi:hypothetical protein
MKTALEAAGSDLDHVLKCCAPPWRTRCLLTPLSLPMISALRDGHAVDLDIERTALQDLQRDLQTLLPQEPACPNLLLRPGVDRA